MENKDTILKWVRTQIRGLIILATDDGRTLFDLIRKQKKFYKSEIRNLKIQWLLDRDPKLKKTIDAYYNNIIRLDKLNIKITLLFKLLEDKLCVKKITSKSCLIKKMQETDHAIYVARQFQSHEKIIQDALEQLLDMIHWIMDKVFKELGNDSLNKADILVRHIDVLYVIFEEYEKRSALRLTIPLVLGFKIKLQCEEAHRDFFNRKKKLLVLLRNDVMSLKDSEIKIGLKKITELLTTIRIKNKKHLKINDCYLDKILKIFIASVK